MLLNFTFFTRCKQTIIRTLFIVGYLATRQALGSSRTAIDIPPLGTEVLQNVNTTNTFISSNCPINPSCDPNNKFRTADGSCNNLRQPKYGASGTPLQRILPNRYFDGMIFGIRFSCIYLWKSLLMQNSISDLINNAKNFLFYSKRSDGTEISKKRKRIAPSTRSIQ